MKSASILLIVNPVSGRMKSKAGLFEILDELYRFDVHHADDDIPTLPLTDSVDEVFEEPEHDEEGSHPAYGYVTPDTLGGDPAPDRRVTLCPTMYRGHATQLASVAAAEGFDTVICCGGDGTLNETIAGLLTIPADKRPALGYIPAGSTNDFATSLGLPTTLRGAARMAVGDGETPIDIGLFTPVGQDQFRERIFSYIASFGIFTAASYSTPQSVKNIFGHTAYLLEGAKDLTKITPHHAAFELDDGTHLEGDYIFGAVTNTTSAGGIFKFPSGSVSMSDGQMEVFLVHKPHSAAELTRVVSAVRSGNFDNCPLIEFYHASSVTVTLEEPLSWSLDGEEAMGGTKIRIGCLPGAVRFKRQRRTYTAKKKKKEKEKTPESSAHFEKEPT